MAEVDAVRLAALGIGLVGLLAAAGGIVRFRGERPLAPFSLVLGAAGLAASAAMSVLLPPISFKTPVLWGLLGGGALLGLLASRAVRVRRDPGGIVVKGGAWHLLPASLALVGLQVAGFARSIDGIVVSTAAIVACTAFAVAAAGVLLLRGSTARLRPGSVMVAAGGPAAFAAPPTIVRTTTLPPASIRSAAPVAAPVDSPSVPVGPPPAADVPSGPAGPRTAGVVISCAGCGGPVSVGWRHCVSCGAALAWG